MRTLFIILFIPFTLFAYHLSGTVTWIHTGQPASDVPVRVLSESGEELAVTRTQSDGSYQVTDFTGVAQPPMDYDLKIHPNPCGRHTRLSGLAAAAEVTVFNILGQQVLAAHTTGAPLTLDLAHRPAGVYIVQVRTGAQIRHLKLLKTAAAVSAAPRQMTPPLRKPANMTVILEVRPPSGFIHRDTLTLDNTPMQRHVALTPYPTVTAAADYDSQTVTLHWNADGYGKAEVLFSLEAERREVTGDPIQITLPDSGATALGTDDLPSAIYHPTVRVSQIVGSEHHTSRAAADSFEIDRRVVFIADVDYPDDTAVGGLELELWRYGEAVASAVTDQKGVAHFNVDPGNYVLKFAGDQNTRAFAYDVTVAGEDTTKENILALENLMAPPDLSGLGEGETIAADNYPDNVDSGKIVNLDTLKSESGLYLVGSGSIKAGIKAALSNPHNVIYELVGEHGTVLNDTARVDVLDNIFASGIGVDPVTLQGVGGVVIYDSKGNAVDTTGADGSFLAKLDGDNYIVIGDTTTNIPAVQSFLNPGEDVSLDSVVVSQMTGFDYLNMRAFLNPEIFGDNKISTTEDNNFSLDAFAVGFPDSSYDPETGVLKNYVFVNPRADSLEAVARQVESFNNSLRESGVFVQLPMPDSMNVVYDDRPRGDIYRDLGLGNFVNPNTGKTAQYGWYFRQEFPTVPSVYHSGAPGANRELLQTEEGPHGFHHGFVITNWTSPYDIHGLKDVNYEENIAFATGLVGENNDDPRPYPDTYFCTGGNTDLKGKMMYNGAEEFSEKVFHSTLQKILDTSGKGTRFGQYKIYDEFVKSHHSFYINS